MPHPGPEPDWAPGSGAPLLSIIVPVYREGGKINELIGHLLQLEKGGSAEIILVDGDAGSTLREIHPGNHSLVRSMLSSKGRGRQMNQGAEKARAEILLFLHADTRLPQDGIVKIIASLEPGDIVGGAFGLGIDTEHPGLRMIARIATLRSRLTRIPYGDQALFFTRNGFRTLGGFPDWPLMEDVELMRRMKSRGWSIVMLREVVKTSPRRWEKEGIVYCTFRNWTLYLLYRMGISPWKLVRWYSPAASESILSGTVA